MYDRRLVFFGVWAGVFFLLFLLVLVKNGGLPRGSSLGLPRKTRSIGDQSGVLKFSVWTDPTEKRRGVIFLFFKKSTTNTISA